MIDLSLIQQYGWPMFILVAGSISLIRQYIVMGWTYKEKCQEVEAWQKRHDDWKDQAQSLQISIKDALALIDRGESK